MARPQLPTPAFPLQTLPTPQVADRVIVERYDHSLARFGPRNSYSAIPTYGIAHPDTRNFSGYKLAHIKLAEPDDWYDWYWVNERLNQDAYNAEISYPYADTAYPRYERSYVVLRSSYTPLTWGTADSVNAALVLVKEEESRLRDPVLDSLFVAVKRTYERRPSPWIIDYGVEPETRCPIQMKHRIVYAPDTAAVQVATTATANGTTTLTTAATLPATVVGSLVYLQGGSGPLDAQLRQIVSRPTTTSIVVDAVVASSTAAVCRIGGAPFQVPFYDHTIDGMDANQAVEKLEIFNSGALPDDREERGYVEYTFPALLFDIVFQNLTARDGTGKTTINPLRRAAFRQEVPKREEISYGVRGDLVPPPVFSPVLSDYVYNGITFSIREQNTLCDGFTVDYTSGTYDPKWPYFVESYVAGATDTTATEYQAFIDADTELTIGASVTPWRYGLDRMVVAYTVAR